MRTLIALAAAAAFTTAPAFAAKVTIEFTPEGADPITVVLDDVAMTVTGPDGTAPFTFDVPTNTMCVVMEPKTCVTFEGEAKEAVAGESAAYTSNNGTSGVAKVLSVE
ncbi:MAG: hypothetical protein Hens3KO_25950 [Henriciella sp.]